jgi:1-acyl-sn-glycerol-3-phosphate acyltransferase
VIASLLAIAAVLGLLAAPFTSRRRPLRLALFALTYCFMETAAIGLSALLWLRYTMHRVTGRASRDVWLGQHQTLLARALGWVLGAAKRYLGFNVVVTPTSADDVLHEEVPILVLARHGGPGDSFALVHLLLTRYDRGVRIVLKEILQLDPALDIVLNRLGCCFLPGDKPEDGLSERLAELTRDLRPKEVLLLFPEGANWTPRRRARAIRHLEAHHQARSARAADLMENVLPPRPDGVLACLKASPNLSVVITAHAGLDRIVSAAQAWRELPLQSSMAVRIWPAVEAPQGRDKQVAWLTTEWAVVDEWIDGYRAHAVDPAF